MTDIFCLHKSFDLYSLLTQEVCEQNSAADAKATQTILHFS